MKFWKKLQNPFVLTGQGFLVGAAIFFAAQPDSAPQRAPAESGSVLSNFRA